MLIYTLVFSFEGQNGSILLSNVTLTNPMFSITFQFLAKQIQSIVVPAKCFPFIFISQLHESLPMFSTLHFISTSKFISHHPSCHSIFMSHLFLTKLTKVILLVFFHVEAQSMLSDMKLSTQCNILIVCRHWLGFLSLKYCFQKNLKVLKVHFHSLLKTFYYWFAIAKCITH